MPIQHVPTIRKEAAIRLMGEGMITQAEAAALCGVNRAATAQWAGRAGISPSAARLARIKRQLAETEQLLVSNGAPPDFRPDRAE